MKLNPERSKDRVIEVQTEGPMVEANRSFILAFREALRALLSNDINRDYSSLFAGTKIQDDISRIPNLSLKNVNSLVRAYFLYLERETITKDELMGTTTETKDKAIDLIMIERKSTSTHLFRDIPVFSIESEDKAAVLESILSDYWLILQYVPTI